MANNIIPPPNTKGIYTLRSPWVSDLTRTYTCSAIRFFVDIEAKGEDVFETYYSPLGIARERYDEDVKAGAAIITLTNDVVAPIYVPSTYIVHYPNMAAVSYNYNVVSVGLGALYDGLSLDFFMQQVGSLASTIVGVTPTVTLHLSTLTDAVTPAEHQTIEANRQAAIQNNTTERSQIVALQEQVTRLQATVDSWEAVARQEGWMD